MKDQYDPLAGEAERLNRRSFLGKTAVAATGIAMAGAEAVRAAGEAPAPEAAPALAKPEDLPNGGKPIKIFCCDFNFVLYEQPRLRQTRSAAHDWAFVDPQEYFDWHRDFGVNCMFMQAFTTAGYAFYPTKLGPVAPGPGVNMLPKLYDLSQKAGMPFCSYFSCGNDGVMSDIYCKDEWLVPGTNLLAPESPWTDLLCKRIVEFLRQYPVEWVCFDPFTYGKLGASKFRIRPAWFVKKPFREIIGREMPEDASKITPEESLRYMREILARQFHRIQEAVHEGHPGTKTFYNPPFYRPAEPLWVDHPMLNECDMLNAESSDDVVPWLLKIRKPKQRVMTVIVGRPDGVCYPETWKRWYRAGCDFFGYAWAIPPDFRPHPRYAKDLAIIRQAYHEMP